MGSPIFDPHSDEDSLPFYKCRAEDIRGGGFEDLACHSFTEGVLNMANREYSEWRDTWRHMHLVRVR
jgi:hypothetical protein